jgi:small subunit ribosomal protein S2
MSEATGDPPALSPPGAPAPELPPTPDATAADAAAFAEERTLSIRALLEAGAHFGHQTQRWDPQMKPFLFGERNGIHIINLDHTLVRFREALSFLRETVAQGGKVLFVATKRQARTSVERESRRSGQFYVNNRWLGGMLTNFRTVKKSIERFKEQLALLEDEEKIAALSKKERARVHRIVAKYRKSLEGIVEMTRLPDALFVIDLKKEHIAVSEAGAWGSPSSPSSTATAARRESTTRFPPTTTRSGRSISTAAWSRRPAWRAPCSSTSGSRPRCPRRPPSLPPPRRWR